VSNAQFGNPSAPETSGTLVGDINTNGYTIFDTPGDVTVNDQLGVATSVSAPVYYTAAANPGDAVAGLNLGSTESICWERTTPGNDSCIGPIVNNSGITVTGSLATVDNIGYYVGTGADSTFIYSTAQTPDATQLTTGADSRAIIVVETADAAFDFAHPLQTNPTIFVHSANQSTTEWISMTHDATNGVLDVGAGSVSVPDGIITPSVTTTSASPATAGLVRTQNNENAICSRDSANTTNYCLRLSNLNYWTPTGNGYLLTDAKLFAFGDSADSFFLYSTVHTPDAMTVTTSTESNAFVIYERADYTSGITLNSGIAYTDPTLYIHSNDVTDALDWGTISYSAANQSFDIDVGQGTVRFKDAITSNATNLATTGVIRLGNAEQICWELVSPGTDRCVSLNSSNLFALPQTLMPNDTTLAFGTTTASQGLLLFSTTQTPDSMVAIPGTLSNSILVYEKDDLLVDFALPLQSNPTIAIQSADGTKTYQRSLLSYAGMVSQVGSKGATTTTGSGAESTVTCSGGGSATLTAASLVPDGAMLLGITTRITTALTGSTGFSVGDGSDADLFGVQAAATQGATTGNADATAQWGNPQLSAMSITLSFAGGSCTAGAIVINAHYTSIAAATQN
jgi:hypothetical protein